MVPVKMLENHRRGGSERVDVVIRVEPSGVTNANEVLALEGVWNGGVNLHWRCLLRVLSPTLGTPTRPLRLALTASVRRVHRRVPPSSDPSGSTRAPSSTAEFDSRSSRKCGEVGSVSRC